MDESEADVLACMSFPAQHRTKLNSANGLERLHKEVKRRADVVGIFPNEDSIIRLIGAVHFEQNDEWQTATCRSMPSRRSTPLRATFFSALQRRQPDRCSQAATPESPPTLTDVTLMTRLAGKTAAETIAAMTAAFRRLDPKMRGSFVGKTVHRTVF